MFGMGPMELFIILLIVLLVFGSHRVVDLARSLGEAVREFKRGMREIDASAPPPPPPPAHIAMNPPQPPASGGSDPHGGHH